MLNEFSRLGTRVTPVLPIDVADGLKLDPARARQIGESLSSDYCFAEPFPHIVLENFLPPELLYGLLEHFPQDKLASDVVFDAGYAGHHKRQILPADCDDYCRRAFDFFNSQPFLEFLEGLSSMEGLLPDPYFVGGGFHEIGRGGKLGIHADFRINNRLHLSRRMNVIIYLNENWCDEYNGSLELWSRDMKAKVKSVAPIFNRCVIFNTDADSYHGHPDPLTTPDGVLRRSVALYYYTASKAIYEEVPNLSTMYAARPGDDAQIRREAAALRRDQYLAQWVPPAVLRYSRGVMRRVRRLGGQKA
ncbi:2OG-Fe(II) oxygenase [Rhizobacter sp. Root404]|uniref:2OG-Fe(II) oxygenase n=1 Tax=Rhizobacter sp. Root404 TaxID=1736528 RepID=UPI0006F53CF2|nr:2OG-Fe(II) oxygenase [Rhizobacter sp. Root404]KQW40244.1 proline hydroxylase [Rhizobacter sp. Root404]